MELEQSGQRAVAVQRYLQALQEDPGHLESRQRLAVLAPVVLEDHLAQAANDRRRGAAVHEGTQRVLFLPVFAPTKSTARENDFAITVGDALQRRHWR